MGESTRATSKESFFEDEPLNPSIEDYKPYDVYELVVGGPTGIPDWLAKRLNRIIGCSTLKIDVRQYVKAEGAKWEPASEQNYPMRSWSIELREAINSSSAIHEEDAIVHGNIHIIATVNSKGFGLNDAGGSEQQIQDIF